MNLYIPILCLGVTFLVMLSPFILSSRISRQDGE